MHQERGRPEDVPESDGWKYFGRYVGQALQLQGDLDHVSVDKIAEDMTNFLERKITTQDIENMETGELAISWPCFALWCEIIGSEPEKIVALARRLLKRENDPDSVIIEGASENFKNLMKDMKRSPKQDD